MQAEDASMPLIAPSKSLRMCRHPLAYEIPPTRGCPVNELPNELLTEIFMHGMAIEEQEAGAWQDDGDDQNENHEDQINGDVKEDEDVQLSKATPVALEGHSVSPPPHSTHTPASRAIIEELDTGLSFQVLVSHVCRHWRALALECPVLWTSIEFTEPSPFTKARTWLERSKGLPLQINVDTADPDYESDDEEGTRSSRYSMNDLTEILSLVLPHAQRWKKLVINVNQYEHMHTVLHALMEAPPAPLLESLYLSDWRSLEDTENFEPAVWRVLCRPTVLFQNETPKLRDLSLSRVHVDWTRSTGLWANLTDLELAYHAKDVRPSWAAFAHMLKSSSSTLRTLVLSLSGPSDSNPENEDEMWPVTPIVLPVLTELGLANLEQHYLCQLQWLLYTPMLRVLTLDLEADDFTTFAMQLIAPVPSDPQGRSLLHGIRTLKILGFQCAESCVPIMYDQLSHLEELFLDCRYINTYFFWRLAFPVDCSADREASIANSSMNRRYYCPQLQKLSTTGISSNFLITLVRNRMTAGLRLPVLNMNKDDASDKDVPWLRSNVGSFSTFIPDDESVEEEDEESIGLEGTGETDESEESEEPEEPEESEE